MTMSSADFLPLESVSALVHRGYTARMMSLSCFLMSSSERFLPPVNQLRRLSEIPPAKNVAMTSGDAGMRRPRA